MNTLGVTIVLGLFALISQGCAQSCEFPHEGNGKVLGQTQGYIYDSALVWVDVAENCFPFVTDPKGIDALKSWIDATQGFNIAMIEDDEDASLKMLHKANDSLRAAAPFIGKSDLSELCMKVYEELGAILKTKNMQDINDFSIVAYSQFREKLGCPID